MIVAGLVIAALGFAWLLLQIMLTFAHISTGGDASFAAGVIAIVGGLLLALAGTIQWALS